MKHSFWIFVLGVGVFPYIALKILMQLPFFELDQNFGKRDFGVVSRVAGQFVLQVEKNGDAWYVHPKRLNRSSILLYEDFLTVAKRDAMGVTAFQLESILSYGEQALLGRNFDQSLAKELRGTLLLVVDREGEIWYVDMKNFVRHPMRNEREFLQTLARVGEGISNHDLATVSIFEE